MHLIILAGGRNSRIQTKKALLAVGGKPIIERLLARLAPLTDGQLIVTGDPEAFAFTKVATVGDRHPGLGPLAGVEAGLYAAGADLNLVVACDLPFASPELATRLRQEAEAHPEADVVMPSWRQGREPLFALYRGRVAELLTARLEAGELRMGKLSSVLNVREVDVDAWAEVNGVDLPLAFCNVNTWEEWRKAEEVAREREAVLPPLFAVVGWQDSGKTTLATGLVAEFKRAGLRVAVIKHDPHAHETDGAGKDTFLHRQAGADLTVLASPNLLTQWERVDQPLSLATVVRRLPPVDLVLVEGWKREPVPRVVVQREGAAAGEGGPPEAGPLASGPVLAVVAGSAEARERLTEAFGAPGFAPAQTAALAEHLLRCLGLRGGASDATL